MTESNPSNNEGATQTEFVAYSPTARFYHWLMVFLIAIQFPLGLYMHYRAHDVEWVNADGETVTGLFDATTRLLYDSHKFLGLILLALILARLYYRVTAGAPKPDPSLTTWQTALSKTVHALLYVALIAVPFLGYLAAAYFGATTLFGTVHVPSIVIEDKDFGRDVIGLHIWGTYVLLGLVALHLAGTLYHHMIKRDNVVARMLPNLKKKTTVT